LKFQWRIVVRDGRGGAQDIERIAFLEDVAVQSLPPGMVGLVVRCPGRQVCVGVSVDADEETLDAAEQGVVFSSADGGKAFGVGAAVKSGRERVGAVGNQVEDRLTEGPGLVGPVLGALKLPGRASSPKRSQVGQASNLIST
jgi:hypothetical protein